MKVRLDRARSETQQFGDLVTGAQELIDQRRIVNARARDRGTGPEDSGPRHHGERRRQDAASVHADRFYPRFGMVSHHARTGVSIEVSVQPLEYVLVVLSWWQVVTALIPYLLLWLRHGVE